VIFSGRVGTMLLRNIFFIPKAQGMQNVQSVNRPSTQKQLSFQYTSMDHIGLHWCTEIAKEKFTFSMLMT
jgi:hypothetical protein